MKEMKKVKHKWWKKRLKKMFTDSDFYGCMFFSAPIVGGMVNVPTQFLFNLLLGCNFWTVAIITILLTIVFAWYVFIENEMYTEKSDYDEAIAQEERTDEKENVQAEKYKNIAYFKESVISLNALKGYENLSFEAKNFEFFIDEFYYDEKIVGQKRNYIENVLPIQLTEALESFLNLSPQHQSKINQQLCDALQKIYTKAKQQLAHNEQVEPENYVELIDVWYNH